MLGNGKTASGQPEAPVQPELQIVITYNVQTGGIQVLGPLDNRVLMHGILETAKDIVTAHHQKKHDQQAPVAIPPSGGRIINPFGR